ncbi:hypothetical protein [Comamonas guangdongensis]|uniref:Uncharacterized protein n=1 Tax=Comamonas guangdongensis TaxID=510515 RepID=A0ABV3ZXE9_9BURK
MTQEKTSDSSKERLALQWPAMLRVLTVFVAIGTVALHLIGDVRHRQYLHYWGIDAGLFPKTTDWILINGYYGIVDRFAVILTAIFGNIHWLLVATVVIGVYVFVLQTPVSKTPGKLTNWVLRRAEWQQRLARYIVLTAMAVAMMPLTLILLTALMVIPAALGESGGEAAAASQKAELIKGCWQPRTPCVEIKKDGVTVANGFVIDTSASYIAIFDTEIQRSRVIPLEKMEFVSHPSLK